VYLFFIILIGLVFNIGRYDYRLFGPGSFLLFIGLIFFVQQRGTKQFFNAFKGFLLFFAIWSYLLNVPYTAWKSSTLNPTYFEVLNALQEKYADVEKDSIIVFAPVHINYLYTDMQTRNPNGLHDLIYKEKWSDFMKRIGSENKKNIYMATPEIELLHEDIDQSVVDFVKKYDKGTLVKLR
jgi:energy-coupling factor transporter transmembrane protein EcfT